MVDLGVAVQALAGMVACLAVVAGLAGGVACLDGDVERDLEGDGEAERDLEGD